MSRETDQLPLFEGDEEISHRTPKVKWFACVGITVVGTLALFIAIGVSYSMSLDIHNTTTIMPGPDRTSPRPGSLEERLNPIALSGNVSNPIPADSVPFSVFSLMVWGSPGSFGVEDKETRVAALGAWIAQDKEHDVWLLNDLWMRPDHDTIKMLLPKGYHMTSVEALSAPTCDGMAAPEFCSGLAIVSRHPLNNVQFFGFSNHGDAFWDYEYFLRRGLGVATIEMGAGHTVVIIVTSLASIDYNFWYREHQVAELVTYLSDTVVKAADHLILAGDFNVDPRDNEDTLKSIGAALTNTLTDAEAVDPTFVTLGNKANTYTEHGQAGKIYDYIWFRPGGGTSLESYTLMDLRTKKEELSLSDHMGQSAKFTLNRQYESN